MIERQLQFVKWLKDRGIYNSYASAAIMRNMQTVWEQLVPPQFRFANGRNPNGLQLGERVKFIKTATIEYRDIDSELKTLKFKDCGDTGVVVGVCYKCEGERLPPRTYHGLDGYDYEPANFKTTKRHLFYEIKTCLHSKILLVHPDHVESLI